MRLFLQRPIDPARDHVRGGNKSNGIISVVVYGDYLCPYCRRLPFVLARLRQVLGERLEYVFRHFPNEAAHPGATLIARASEAAAKQGRFWEMHDWLYEREPPLTDAQIRNFASDLGLDMARFIAISKAKKRAYESRRILPKEDATVTPGAPSRSGVNIRRAGAGSSLCVEVRILGFSGRVYNPSGSRNPRQSKGGHQPTRQQAGDRRHAPGGPASARGSMNEGGC
jgi:hypothetical protein